MNSPKLLTFPAPYSAENININVASKASILSSLFISGRKFQRKSILAAKLGKKIIAPRQYSKTMN